MNNLPFTLPTCRAPATVRLEVYTPADGELHGSLDASVYVCEQHGIGVVSAIWRANLIAHKVTMAPDIDRACGESFVFPTGQFGGQR